MAASRTADDLRKTEDKVVEVAARIAAGEFEPHPGLQCNSCSYHGICPAHEVEAFVPAALLAVKVH